MFDFNEYYEMGFKRSGETQEMDGVKFMMETVNIGKLTIHSGQLVAIDPFLLPETEPFEIKLPNGEHPVDLAYLSIKEDQAMKRPRLARVAFTSAEPVSFKLATTADEDASTLGEGDILGYPVETGSGAFIDAATLKEAQKIYQKSSSAWEDIMSDEFDKVETPDTDGYVNYQVENSKGNIVAFRTFEGDGIVPTFIGLDKDGNTCCMVSSL